MPARTRASASPLRDLARRVESRVAPVRLTGLRGAARALMAAELVRAHEGRPVLILGTSSKQCDELLDDLRSVLGERDGTSRLHVLPRHDTLPYDRFSPQPFVIAQRMDVLYRWLVAREPGPLAAEAPPVVVSDWTALSVRVPGPDTLRAHTREIAVGDSLDRDELVASLVEAGYNRMPIVEEPGELAVRGGIVDLYPPHSRNPLRIEFFGDEVDSIREFDAASQRSQSKLVHAVAPPPRELLIDRDTVVERSDAVRALASELGTRPGEVAELMDALLRGHLPPGVEALAPILQHGQVGVLDYLPADALVIIDDPEGGHDRLARYWAEAEASFAAAIEIGRLAVPVADLLVAPSAIEAALEARHCVSLERLDVVDAESRAERIAVETTSHAELRRELGRTRTHEQALAPLADLLANRVLDQWRVVITASALSAAERLKDLLSKYGLDANVATDPRACWQWSLPGRIEIRVTGFRTASRCPMQELVVVTDEEIFGKRERRRHRTAFKEGVAVEGIAQLAPGDFLVHSDHGIGVYRGLGELERRRHAPGAARASSTPGATSSSFRSIA